MTMIKKKKIMIMIVPTLRDNCPILCVSNDEFPMGALRVAGKRGGRRSELGEEAEALYWQGARIYPEVIVEDEDAIEEVMEHLH